ncbi:MAG TPA: Gfo/Idh/MocA family oxidoreductase [Pyrinomonadaceae bacterium]|jgi:predicted dehydrogenase|nr:Gfo/Idh/MocA family oxidoreductase [Pyrinomonadaceae bacterium]
MKVRWGILGTAKIALTKVIPAMQRSDRCEIAGIASRDLSKARTAAAELNIPNAYGSYEELLADSSIEAVYNPLPNHLHVPLTAKAAAAGKHVLCEKPVALNATEARTLIDVRNRTGVRIQEAFMVRTHPQWLETRRLIHSGRIGSLRSITGFFSYFNPDPTNIRNQLALGGGALMDIGCYPITISRFMYETEPRRVLGFIERDAATGTDTLTSAVLDFPNGRSTFTCSTRLAPYQRMIFFGTEGRIEVLVPFNAPNDRPTRIVLDDGKDLTGESAETIEFPICDQYEIQGSLFSRAIHENREQPIPLEDAIDNMAVIDAVFRSAMTSQWEEVQ